MKYSRFTAAALLATLTAAAVTARAPDALASPLEVYGAGARGAAMASAQTATSEGPAAIHYNVGSLALATPGIVLGAFATFDNARILLKPRPAGYDIPDIGLSGSTVATGQERRARRDTESLEPLYAVTLGGVTSFGTERLRAGMLVTLPTNGLLRLDTHFPDERERLFSNQLHFELIGQRLHRFTIDLGLAHQLTDWLSFGIGGTFLPGASVGTEVFVADPTDQSDVEINAAVTTTNAWGLRAGAQIALPWAGMDLGLSYRGAVAFRIAGANALQIHGIAAADDELAQSIDWTPLYSPGQLAVGLALPLGESVVALDGHYTLWSDYRDRHGARPEFRDRLSVHLGLDHRYSEATSLRAGVGFDPTPVPDQTGRTNYVDNSRITTALGAAHRFTLFDLPVEAAWFLQLQYLLPRETDKQPLSQYPTCAPGEQRLCDELADDTRDPRTGRPYAEAAGLQTGNPGFPGFTSGGWIGALGLELRY